MDMSNFHIAQQSRRDKLRIQQDLGVFITNNLGDSLTYDSTAGSCRAGNICYDPSEFCPEMINFAAGPHHVMKDGVVGHRQDHEKRDAAGEPPFTAAAGEDPQFFQDWVGSHGSVFVGDGGSSSFKIANCNAMSSLDVKPSYLGYQDEMNGSSALYHNALQEIVTSSNARSFGPEFRLKSSSESGWVVGGSELVLLPAYADQMRLKNHSVMISRPVDGCSQWSEFAAVKDNTNSQALSLSLSSVPSPKVHEIQATEKDFQARDDQNSRNWKPELFTQQTLTHRNPGPLGPFTGYTTILRNSKFLRPAQLLLEELCCMARPKDIEICHVTAHKIFDDVRVSREALVSDGEPASKSVTANSGGGMSGFVFDGSSDKSREAGGSSCSPSEVYRPEYLQKRAKLLFMQDEVGKRYKQYHQQMQMVVSSFESVAGLTSATPYVSLALKMISKHFKSLKNAIADQLKSIKNALGEESSSPSGTSGSKGDGGNVSMLKFFDQSFQKQKNLGILEGQHIWRPQRGLPERAVSVLRAWLFDHFLHPYPTDTDKHMLASQTGLTRNQVSNWFINARVRVWKPMVEEIHMLETKGMQAESGSNVGKTPVEECRDQGDRLGKQHAEPSQIEQHVNQDKRSRIEYNNDGSLMGLVPSHRSGIEMGGMGSVSLTLGLRQSAENAQRPQMQPELHLRPHFGGHIIRDYVG